MRKVGPRINDVTCSELNSELVSGSPTVTGPAGGPLGLSVTPTACPSFVTEMSVQWGRLSELSQPLGPPSQCLP